MSIEQASLEEGSVEIPLRWETESDRIREKISKGYRSARAEGIAPESVGAVEARHRVCLTKSFQLADLFSSTTPAAADACISALLSLAVAKSRGPLPAGGTDCSTLRSTNGLNGASFWAKRG